MNSKWITRLLTTFILLYLATNPASAQQYVLTRLGFAPFGNTISGAEGINNNGDVVGFDATINGAFLYHAGVVSSLNFSSARGVAINSHGSIAIASLGADMHSYVYDPARLPKYFARLTDIGTLGGSGGLNNGGQTIAHGMNDSRIVIGSATVPSTTQLALWHAFSWANGQMTDLDLQPYRASDAWGINNLGQIVGASIGLDGYERAFQIVNGVMTDLDPANPTYDSCAWAINDSGQIVVVTNLAWHFQYVSRGVPHVVAYRGPTNYTVIYSGGSSTSIGSLGPDTETFGTSINTAGDVVGWSRDINTGKGHGFLYHAGTLADLNNLVTNLSGWRVVIATRINDSGEIVCYVKNDSTLEWQLAVLTPVPFD